MVSNRFHRLLDKRSGQQNFLVELRVACVIVFSDSQFSTTVPQFRCLSKRETQVHIPSRTSNKDFTQQTRILERYGKIWTSLENVTITRFKAPELQNGQVACTHKLILFAKAQHSGQRSRMTAVKCSLVQSELYTLISGSGPQLWRSPQIISSELCKFSYLRDRSLT